MRILRGLGIVIGGLFAIFLVFLAVARQSDGPIAIIAGSDEFDNNQVTIKNMESGASKAHGTSDREEWLKAEGFQETISRSDLISYLKKLIG